MFMKAPSVEEEPAWSIYSHFPRLYRTIDSLGAILADTIDTRIAVIGDEFLGGALREIGLSGNSYLRTCNILMDSLGWNVQQPGDTLEALYCHGILSEIHAFPSSRRGFYRISVDCDGMPDEWCYVPEERWIRQRAVSCSITTTVWGALMDFSLPEDLTPSGHLVTWRTISISITMSGREIASGSSWKRFDSPKRLKRVSGEFLPRNTSLPPAVSSKLYRFSICPRVSKVIPGFKMPVPFGRISSGYSSARLHPVLGYTRAHRGIDYAAPMGTDIYAVGDGVITMRQWNGGYGNYVRVRHANGYLTGYGHMTSFAAGQSVGTYVRQGQIIGYIGSTGLSTGPHLHFEMKKDGVFVNPATEILPPADPLEGRDLDTFILQLPAMEAAWKAICDVPFPVPDVEEVPADSTGTG